MRVFVQINNDRSCLLNADRIDTSNEEYTRVYRGDALVGIFDNSYLVCAYITEPTNKEG